MIQVSNRYEGLDGEVPVPAKRRCMAASGGGLNPFRRPSSAARGGLTGAG